MSTGLTVPPYETGIVRVFAVDLDGTDAQAFAEDPAAIARALGADTVDPRYVDVFPTARLEGVGLAAYLREGHGLAAEAIGPDAATLDARDGWVAVIASGAFGDKATTLSPSAPLRLIGTYSDTPSPISFDPLPSGGAEGTLGGPAAPPPPPMRGGKAGKYLALAVLLLIVAAFVLLGGGR